jgi:hypothetical protein
MYRFQLTLWQFKGKPSPFRRSTLGEADTGPDSGYSESKFSDSLSSPHQVGLDLGNGALQRPQPRSRMASAPASKAGVVSLNGVGAPVRTAMLLKRAR